MCGIAGVIADHADPATDAHLRAMMAAIGHRGPDDSGYCAHDNVAFGFARLAILDFATGNQPILSEDGAIAVVCNGEIFNHQQLRRELVAAGHRFSTGGDIEVICHLYEEHGADLFRRLHGQFACAIHDRRRRVVLLGRDRFGIAPLYHARAGRALLFASEIKALLAHPGVERAVDLTGLDQVLTFPGTVAPRTLFRGVSSLRAGHYLRISDGGVSDHEYWDLVYPLLSDLPAARGSGGHTEEVAALFQEAVRTRMAADVPVGTYISGGLDSSLIAATMRGIGMAGDLRSFSVRFDQAEFSEHRYQRYATAAAASVHQEISIDRDTIARSLRTAVRHGETAMKESYNTCSLALSAAARAAGVRVVLTGEGADELFGGYVGYRMDRAGARRLRPLDIDAVLEEEMNDRVWGDPRLFYEKEHLATRRMNRWLYSPALSAAHADFDCLDRDPIDRTKIAGRHRFHQRSYLDVKLRLSEHLLGDHGDRMLLANAVEGRYPFLDENLVDRVTCIHPDDHMEALSEKQILRLVGAGMLPEPLRRREKFAFRAPGSAYLIDQPWIRELIDPERIRREGYFDPAAVETLSRRASAGSASLDPHLEDDLLMAVITFGILREEFSLPVLG